MKALILAGGFGTRLQGAVKDVPKPMAVILGKPFLEHQLDFLKEQGIDDIILTVHHMADKIKSYFGDGKRCGVNITYSEEETPLGTAGAIKKAEKYIDDTFFVLNGDSYSKLNFNTFLEFHRAKRSNFSMSLAKPRDASHFGGVILDGSKVVEFSEKSCGEKRLINSGCYIFEPVIFDNIEPGKKVSLEREIFPRLAKEGKVFGYPFDGYFIDVGRPETYSQFKKDMIKKTMAFENESIREVMQRITNSKINLVLIIDKEGKLLGVLNDRLIREYLIQGGRLETQASEVMVREPVTANISDEESKINDLFLRGIHHLPILNQKGKVEDIRFFSEEIKTENYPIVRGRVPLRISFAGGGTDFPYFFEKYGGVVISSTIDKYCYATAIKRADSRIIVNYDSIEKDIILDCRNLEYNGKLDIIKAIVKLMKIGFGFELHIHNDIPPGRGLGSSASFAVLITKLLSQLQGTEYSDNKIAEIAYQAEHKELGIKGGWQDQYAAVTGGFNFMEFNENETIIYPLRLKEEVINELDSHLLLCYVGGVHFSGVLQEELEKSFLENEVENTKRLQELKRTAIEIKDALLTNDLEKIGNLLHESWENKKQINKYVSNPRIDELYEIGIKNGAYGGKLLGAGGAGYILFCYSPNKRNQLVKALEAMGGKIMDFNFESKGVKTWMVQK